MPRSKQPGLVVVTVNYNSWEECGALVASLDGHGVVTSMVIVDHSENGLKPPLRADFPIHMITQENRGYGGGLNAGLSRIAHSDGIVLVCNPDVRLLTPEAVAPALAYMEEHPDVGILVPSCVDSQNRRIRSYRTFYTVPTLLASRLKLFHKSPPQFLRNHFYLDEKDHDPLDVDWGSGAAMLFRLSLFPRLVSFDERFFLYFEDVDICAQVWRHGYRTTHFPGLCFRHESRQLSKRRLYYLMIHLMSLFRFVVKYRGLPTRSRPDQIEGR